MTDIVDHHSMYFSVEMMNTVDPELLTLLQEELALPALAIEAAIEYAHSYERFFPLVLWERGLLTLPQLEAILLRIFT